MFSSSFQKFLLVLLLTYRLFFAGEPPPAAQPLRALSPFTPVPGTFLFTYCSRESRSPSAAILQVIHFNTRNFFLLASFRSTLRAVSSFFCPAIFFLFAVWFPLELPGHTFPLHHFGVSLVLFCSRSSNRFSVCSDRLCCDIR